MKIIIAGDSHGDLSTIHKIVADNSDADMYLYTGDSELSSYDIEPFESVKGDNDTECYPISKTVDTPAGKIFITHGNRLLSYSAEKLKEEGVKVIVRGHSHYHKQEDDHGVYILNPGSTSKPRDNTNGTYLVILINDEEFNFKFVSIGE